MTSDGSPLPPPIVRQGLGEGFPLVSGRCPACGGASLFLGSGGFVTCARLDCPDPEAATDLPVAGRAKDRLLVSHELLRGELWAILEEEDITDPLAARLWVRLQARVAEGSR